MPAARPPKVDVDGGDVRGYPPSSEFRSRALIRGLHDPEIVVADPVEWWQRQARALEWSQEWDVVLDASRPPFARWFCGGTINASHNCLDRHVRAGLGDRVAYHWYGEEGEYRRITYASLLADVERAANALSALGVRPGDVVGIYLPMIPEAVVAMLACARIGALHNVVFGGFSAESVKERMQTSGARVLVTADALRRKGRIAPMKSRLDAVAMPVAATLVVRHCGIATEMGDGDRFWDEALAEAAPTCEALMVEATQPLFLLYSSGSTAKPKGIVHSTGGYLTQVAWTHRHVFDLRPDDDVYWCTADVGWITGHSYVVYGPLLNAATSVMYEGAPDYPHRGVWWDLAARSKTTILYTAPTAIRTCMRWGDTHVEKADLSALRLLGSVGEPINPKAWTWYHQTVGQGRCPVVDTWWQTETGAMMITTLPGAQEAKPGAAGTPLPGVDVAILDEAGEEVETGTGLLVVRHPTPGMALTLYGDDDRFVSTYYDRFGPGTYVTGDAAVRDADGYFRIIGRTDDVINVSGHRLSSAEIESALVSHAAVAEAAVVAAADDLTGQAIVAFVTVRDGVHADEALEVELCGHVANRIGKLARPQRMVWAPDLPKTRSGKIMRRLLRDLIDGRPVGDTTTLGDATVMQSLSRNIAQARARPGVVGASASSGDRPGIGTDGAS